MKRVQHWPTGVAVVEPLELEEEEVVVYMVVEAEAETEALESAQELLPASDRGQAS